MLSRQLLLPVLIAIGLNACATSPNDGYTQTRADAVPYRQAHAECWSTAMNIGGMSQTAFQMNAYKQCMAERGWEDRRTFFGGASR